MNFTCLSCGNCCRLPGYVRLRDNEAERIAEFLGEDLQTFIQTQTRLTRDRQHLSLLENDRGECAFLTPDTRCRIHPVKPAQCRGYPLRWRSEVMDPLCAGLKQQNDTSTGRHADTSNKKFMPLIYLFDLDGTLVDSRADLARAVNLTREHFNLAPLPLDAVVRCVGRGVEDLMRGAIPERPADAVAETLAVYRAHYRAHLLDETVPYPGIPELLEKLSGAGHKLAVVTNKGRAASCKILEGLNLLPFFGAVVGDGDAPALKPDPAPLHFAARLLGRELQPTDWMVGDGDTDLRAGAAAGIRTCFCRWGFSGPNAPLPATMCADTPENVECKM